MVELYELIDKIVVICGAVMAIWGVWKIIKEIKKPSDDIRKKVEEHEAKLKRDDSRLKDIEDYQKVICSCLLTMVDHEITGNGIEQLKSTKRDLQTFLINHQ